MFIARKKAEHEIYGSKLSESSFFYLPSLSTKIIIYKGLLVPEDIKLFYKDLNDPLFVTRLALVHQRFSTNTFPTWDLAQPFRYMCHNGEINTLRGNVARMFSREELMKSDWFGDEIKSILPVVLLGKSESESMERGDIAAIHASSAPRRLHSSFPSFIIALIYGSIRGKLFPIL